MAILATMQPCTDGSRDLYDTKSSTKSLTNVTLSSRSQAETSSDLRSNSISKALYAALYDESHAAKLWRVGKKYLNRPDGLSEYPEHVPAAGANIGRYIGKAAKFWTCGFFPGSLFAILERSMNFPEALPLSDSARRAFSNDYLEFSRRWTKTLHAHSHRTDTHDMGFIVLPALRKDWELTKNQESFDSVIRGARNLATRYSSKTGAVRSWNQALSCSYQITDMDKNFLVIIDSMCNMELLFWAGQQTGDQTLIDIATSHAYAVRQALIRPDGSTYHVVNLDPLTGEIKHRQTHQGYSDDSAWARGQAWGILGFTQTYMWTKDPVFLETALQLTHYFLNQLSKSQHPCPNVPLWDFTAPPDPAYPSGLRDTSAGMIAANGLLLLHNTLQGRSPYLSAALRIAEDTRVYSRSNDWAHFEVDPDGKLFVPDGKCDAILLHSTASNNEHALDRYADHGLVYADYYFLEFGNKLLRMGLA